MRIDQPGKDRGVAQINHARSGRYGQAGSRRFDVIAGDDHHAVGDSAVAPSIEHACSLDDDGFFWRHGLPRAKSL